MANGAAISAASPGLVGKTAPGSSSVGASPDWTTDCARLEHRAPSISYGRV